MAFTYDLTTNVGKIRLLIPDTDWANAVFSDEELTAFVSLESGSVRRAAALALETIAASEAMTLKVIKLLDVQTDGAKLAESLLARAKLLRQQAEADDADAGYAGFEIAEVIVDDFAWREQVINSSLLG
jgi:hypothetical protein